MEAEQLWEFNGGLKLDANKKISTDTPITVAKPQKQYIIPLQQHIGDVGEILVKIGEQVSKGQILARANHLVSASIHSPVSGSVANICTLPIPHPSGLSAECIVVENDFADHWIEKNIIGE